MKAPTWLQGTFVLLVTLFAGAALGVTYERRRTAAPEHAMVDARHFLQRFGRELALDSAQRVAIDSIVSRRQRTVDARWREMQPHVRATLDSTFQEVLRVLTPVQAAKFREMMDAAHAEHSRRDAVHRNGSPDH